MPLNKKYIPDVHLNLNVSGLEQSATLAINELSNKLISEGKKVYKLGLGQSPFPVPEGVVNELRINAHQKDYLPVMGLLALREEIARFHLRTQNVECTYDDVLIGPGTKELMFLLQLTYYGNLVVPSASWISYAPQAHIIGRQIHWIETKQENCWRLMPADLEVFCASDIQRPRILILNYPSNPTGMSYSIQELKALAKVARKYKIILLSDEIYGELHHDGKHVSIAQFYPEGTIISNGISKWCGAGGWRLGALIFPKSLHWLRDGMAVVASETFTSTSAPIQYAAIKAFEFDRSIEKYVDQSRRLLKALGNYIYSEFKKVNIDLPKPEGGFYLFPSFEYYKEKLNEKNIVTSNEFCEKLIIDTGVALLPGSAFGRPKMEFICRLAYVDFDGKIVLENIGDVQPDFKFLKKHCSKIIEATKHIKKWVLEL